MYYPVLWVAILYKRVDMFSLPSTVQRHARSVRAVSPGRVTLAYWYMGLYSALAYCPAISVIPEPN